jgi:hypothetical protein
MSTSEKTALAWLRDFARTGAHAALSEEARRALPGAARVLGRCLGRRWSQVGEPPRPLERMTPEDAVDLLTRQLPRRTATTDARAIVDGVVELLVWAAKHGRFYRPGPRGSAAFGSGWTAPDQGGGLASPGGARRHPARSSHVWGAGRSTSALGEANGSRAAEARLCLRAFSRT